MCDRRQRYCDLRQRDLEVSRATTLQKTPNRFGATGYPAPLLARETLVARHRGWQSRRTCYRVIVTALDAVVWPMVSLALTTQVKVPVVKMLTPVSP
jgi:hypothetical protein